MKTKEQLLEEVRCCIADHEQFIRNTEQGMRDGLPPFDLEPMRIGLHELRWWEAWLSESVRGGIPVL